MPEDESARRISMRWFLWTVPSWIALVLIIALLLGAAPLIDIGTLIVVALILLFWISLDISDKLFTLTNAVVVLQKSFLTKKEMAKVVAEAAASHEIGYGKK